MLISDRYPYIPVEVVFRGEGMPCEAYVDTGFSGGIVLPESQWVHLWFADHKDKVSLGNGTSITVDYWQGDVAIGERSFPVRILCMGDEYIVGREVIDRVSMNFLHGQRLVVDLARHDSLTRPCISRLTPYSPGKPIEEVKRELGLTDVIKMASNENVLGPSPKAIEAIRSLAPSVFYYPEGSAPELRESLAEKWDVSPDQIILGNGSDEVLMYLCLTFLNPGDEIVQAEPTFSEYRAFATLCDGVTVSVPSRDLHHDLPAMREKFTERTRFFFIANPNNPTGTMVTRAEVEETLADMPPHVLTIFDEAYYEYVEDPDYPDSLAYVREGRQVIVLRTFSKAYGLAGLRVGYGIASPDIITSLNQVRQPFNVNSVAQAAALASLADDDQVRRSVGMNSEGKRFLCAEFQRLGLRYAPSQANFIFVDTGKDCRQVFRGLLQRGVIVRTGDVFGHPTYIRVTIGTAEMNERFVRELEAVLQGCQERIESH